MAPRHNGPLFITCQRPGCEQIVEVRDRRVQKLQKYCSIQCGALYRSERPETFAMKQRGGLACGRLRRLAVVDRVHTMLPLEAFRLGYLRGLNSKHRQLRKRKRKEAA